jgi:glutamate synthase domain-containing protein 3
MNGFEDVLQKIEFIGKKEVSDCAPEDTKALLEIIHTARPRDEWAEQMVLGYLTTLCAERMHPEPLVLEEKIDFVGVELEKGHIIIKGDAGRGVGTTMRGGRITIEGSAGADTGKSMTGGEIEAERIESLGNTLGGVIRAKEIGKMDKNQGAEIYIEGKKYRKGFFSRFRL